MSRRTSSTHMAPPVTAYSSFIRGASPLGLPDTLTRPSTSLRTTLSDVEGRRRASASAKATARPRRSASREGGPFAGLASLRSSHLRGRSSRSGDERDRCADWPWLYTRDAAREHNGPGRPPAGSPFVRYVLESAPCAIECTCCS